ncbi:MAG: 4Fe-4S binding protein [Candidatus Asgardarchaeia archaeon]
MANVDLSVEIAGIKLKNPVILSSGPMSKDGESIKRAAENGAGAVVTKTISFEAAKVARPCIIKIPKHGISPPVVINAEEWSDLTLEDWLEREMKIAKTAGVPIIGSIWVPERDIHRVGELAQMVVDAGAVMIEIPGYDPEEVIQLVSEAKKKVDVPVIAKIAMKNFEVEPYIKAIHKAKADAISAIDTMGPVLKIDINTGKPYLGGAKGGGIAGAGRISGQAINPFAVYWIARARQLTDLPLLGIGGITRAEDVVEMLMVGATAVQIHTSVMLFGYKIFSRLAKGLEKFLTEKGYSSVKDIIGYAQQYLDTTKHEIPIRYGGIVSEIDKNKCTGCTLCVQVCPWSAIHMEGKIAISDPSKCYGCGLCTSVCPVDAISLVEVK